VQALASSQAWPVQSGSAQSVRPSQSSSTPLVQRLSVPFAPPLQVQTPPWQVWPLAPQEVPLPRLVKVQPLAGVHASVVQALPSLQVRAEPARQTPLASQASPTVQALPSEQVAPFFTVTVQLAVPLQLRVLQASLTHESAVPAHPPSAWQASA